MRAVSLDISGGSAVSGFLNPGNYVDIIVTIGDQGSPLQTVTLLQVVTVLAVNDRLGAKKTAEEIKEAKRKRNILVSRQKRAEAQRTINESAAVADDLEARYPQTAD